MSDRQAFHPAPPAPPYVLPRAVAHLAPPPRPASTTGVVALVVALVAVVAAPLVGAIAVFVIGSTDIDLVRLAGGSDVDWSALTPVRDTVLVGEVAFWIGTAAGIWAFVQGIVAIASDAGRGQGIAALVLAVIGPVVFALAAMIGLMLGLLAAPV